MQSNPQLHKSKFVLVSACVMVGLVGCGEDSPDASSSNGMGSGGAAAGAQATPTGGATTVNASGGGLATAMGGTAPDSGATGGNGVSTGGSAAGNAAAGGSTTSTGGTPLSTGGVTTGGDASGGNAASTGGATSGGNATGGSAGGGSSTGGETSSGGATSHTGGDETGGLGSGGLGSGGLDSGGSGGTFSGGEAGAAASGGSAGGVSSGEGGVAGMAGGAGEGTGGQSSTYHPCPTNGDACKIMPFGDSITDGYGIAGGYRVELFRLANQAGNSITFVGTGSNGPGDVDGVPFPPNHEGHSGFTIEPAGGRSGIAPLVSTVMPQFTPHIITLMIGTNDAIDDHDMANAPTRLGDLIDSIYDFLPDVLIVVAQPVPSQDDALNARIETYNAAIPAVVDARAAQGRHILCVDMYPVLANNPNYKTELLGDTWHPNSAGHALIGAAWFEALATYF